MQVDYWNWYNPRPTPEHRNSRHFMSESAVYHHSDGTVETLYERPPPANLADGLPPTQPHPGNRCTTAAMWTMLGTHLWWLACKPSERTSQGDLFAGRFMSHVRR